MRFPEEVDHDVLVRLRRVEGQIRGLQRLIEEGADCAKVVTQLSATKGALDRVGFKLLSSGMRHCLDGDDPETNETNFIDLEKLFMKLS